MFIHSLPDKKRTFSTPVNTYVYAVTRTLSNSPLAFTGHQTFVVGTSSLTTVHATSLNIKLAPTLTQARRLTGRFQKRLLQIVELVRSLKNLTVFKTRICACPSDDVTQYESIRPAVRNETPFVITSTPTWQRTNINQRRTIYSISTVTRLIRPTCTLQ